jgi:hypothetical protein
VQQSRARWLETAVLSVAASSGTLNLTRIPGKTLPVSAEWLDLARPGDRAVVVQARPSAFPSELAGRLGPEGSVTAIFLESADRADAVVPLEPNCHMALSGLGDLSTDPRKLAELLAQAPPRDVESYRQFDDHLQRQRRSDPWIADDSVDLVLFDLVDLATVDPLQIRDAVREAFRVLRRHGRFVIAALLADQAAGPEARSSAPLEAELGEWLAAAGFHGITYQWRAALPLRLDDGIETRAYVLAAYKGKHGECLDQGHAVIYRGPWREVHDDDNHRYVRGERTAVCGKTFALLTKGPYAADLIALEPYVDLPASAAPLFDCNTPALRDPRVTKGIIAIAADGETGGCC